MKLKVEQVVERLAYVPTPVEHELVERLSRKQFLDQLVTFLFRHNVHHLIQEPNHLCSLSAMVKIE